MTTQLIAADFLARRQRAFLWDSPRVGKTGAAVIAADYIGVRSALVVTTASGRGVWRRAFPAWQTIPRRVRVLGSDPEGSTDVGVVSWGMLSSIPRAIRQRPDLIILDEDQEATNPEAQQVLIDSKGESLSKGLANMLTDSPLLSAYIIYGTGTDQGLNAAPTASPAITPAWTGINSSLTKQVTLTSSWQRFVYTATLPSTATEVGLEFCWTPTSATGSGSTDGFVLAGVQLENGPFATPFEYHPYAVDYNIALRYYYQINEAAAAQIIAPCTFTTANTTALCMVPLPVAMRVAPTVPTLTAGFALPTTTGQTALNNNTGLALGATITGEAASPTMLPIQASNASGTTAAVGITLPLYSNGGSGVIKASADF